MKSRAYICNIPETKMADPALFAAVVNRNSGDNLNKCISALLDFLPPDRIVVVDCASTDDSLKEVEKRGVHLELLGANIGYAGGNNTALKLIRKWGGRLALIINPDAKIDAHNAAILAELLSDEKDIGAAFPLVYENRNQLEGAYGVLNHRHLLVKIAGKKALEKRKTVKYFDIDFGIGCCFIVRVNDFFDVGGFDENFFAYHDEPDLCKRLRDMGRKVVLMPRVSAFHKIENRDQERSNIKDYFIARNSVLYMKKHGGFFQWIKFLLFLTAGLLYYLPGAVIGNKAKNYRIMGFKDGFLKREINPLIKGKL